MKTYEFTENKDGSMTVHVYDDADRHAKAIIPPYKLYTFDHGSREDIWAMLTLVADRLAYTVDRMVGGEK